MPSTTYSFNKEILKQVVRGSGWVGLIYFIGLFFSVPLQMIMMDTDYYHYRNIRNPFSYFFEIQYFMMIGVPLLLSIFLFSYLHNKQAADFMHSLPVKRAKLFNQYLLVGIMLYIIPVLINGLLVLILRVTLSLQEILTVQEVLAWIGITILFGLFIFFAGAVIATITGIAVFQGILTTIFLLFPTGIFMLVIYSLKFFLNGFAYDYYMSSKVYDYSPILYATNWGRKDIGELAVWLFGLAIIVFYGLALWLYQKRNIESASQALAYPILRPIFTYGVAFCFMLTGGLYFGESKNSVEWLMFGYLFGSLIGYFVARSVIEKTWRVFNLVEWKRYSVFLVATAVLYGLFLIDFTGFEKKVPQLNEIEKVYMGDNLHAYLEGTEYGKISLLSSKENIENVMALHKQIAKLDPIKQSNYRYFTHKYFVYEMKNGDRFVRQYRVLEDEKLDNYYKPIYESKEYKEMQSPILKVQIEDVDKITIIPNAPVNKRLSVTEQPKLQAVLAALKNDMHGVSYENMTKKVEPSSNIEVLLSNGKRVYTDLYPYYEELIALLKESGDLDDAVVSSDDIEEIYILPNDRISKDERGYFDYELVQKQVLSNASSLKVTDKEKIEQCLQNDNWDLERGPYLVLYVYKGNANYEIKAISQKNAPYFIKTHFEK
ncbi:DUF6449 domain-containing protein [Peribacillus acanthi]|uniref:DUF6449 domain-containing protein n=1 Tax=Peribacillus acanthi TaxID=2171554 RepID=UPI000D3E1F0F|nr:DUF6449 domain-containing protein [Peribacillus acanthi]